MSSTRSIYDQGAFQEAVERSTRPGNYHLFAGQYKNCNKCVSLEGPRNNRTRNNSEINQPYSRQPLVVIDSLLSARKFRNSKYTKDRLFHQIDKQLSKIQTFNPTQCNLFLQPEDTRLTHPTQNYRGIYIDRYEWPIIPPVERVFWGNNEPCYQKFGNHDKSNIRGGQSARLCAKDNFYYKRIHRPSDDSVLRPAENLERRRVDCIEGNCK